MVTSAATPFRLGGAFPGVPATLLVQGPGRYGVGQVGSQQRSGQGDQGQRVGVGQPRGRQQKRPVQLTEADPNPLSIRSAFIWAATSRRHC